MEFNIHPMTAAAAAEIDNWKYPGIYSFYDLDQDSDDREEFLDPANWEDHLFAVTDQYARVIGFYSFEFQGSNIEIGLGLCPACTGQGMGKTFVQAGLDFAYCKFNPKSFSLSVAVFNKRAIRVYEKMGFTAEKFFIQNTNGGQYEFIKMSKYASGRKRL